MRIYTHRSGAQTRALRQAVPPPRYAGLRIRGGFEIGILAHAGNRNLGDEALIASVIQGIRARLPDARIRAFTSRAEDTQARHGVKSFPLRPVASMRPVAAGAQKLGGTHRTDGAEPAGWKDSIKARIKKVPPLYRVAKLVANGVLALRGTLRELPALVRASGQLRGVDLLIVAGSQQLIDYIDGPWEHLYTILRWTALARLRGARVAFVSCGVGPIRSSLGARFARWALALAAYRSFRDRSSIEAVERLGIREANLLAPDLGYGLRIPAQRPPASAVLTVNVVAINPVPFNDPVYWLGSDATRYRRYVEALAGFAAWLVSNRMEVMFVPTQLNLDPPVVADILAEMRTIGLGERLPAERVSVPAIDSLDSLVAALERADLVVASRFHGVVLSLALPRPVLGIAYQGKTREAMGQLGLEPFSIDILDLTVERLIERFECLRARWAESAPEVMQRLSEHRSALDLQFDSLARLATASRRATGA